MMISLNWLKEFVDIPSDVTPQKFAEDLTVHVVEVEEVIDQKQMYDKMVIGKITDIQDHPDADKLKICVTDIGLEFPAQIICGGLNIYKGMMCAVALPGSRVKWHGEGDLIALKKTKIRGVESQGMICAAIEIGLSDDLPVDEPNVMNLDTDAAPGTPLADALGLDDVIVDVDNKSLTHRPDLWGHAGLAREVATLYGTTLKNQDVAFNLDGAGDAPPVEVKIENKQLCRRFMAVRIDGVNVGPSDPLIQRRLTAAGMRPINNIVDISNYVMLELGQPNHMFDADKLGEKLVIRNAKSGEKLTTLDDVERKLDPSMLMVTNGTESLAIAGVMGGGNSEVDDDTKSVVIEVANFEPVSVRQTSQKLALRTEASARFEKGLDPVLAERALMRIVDLLTQSVPDAVVGKLADVGDWKTDPTVIETSIPFIQERVGTDVDPGRIVTILQSLGFTVEYTNGDNVAVTVPSWRATGDVLIPEDLVEEVARHYGYHLIEPQLPLMDTKGDDQTNRDLDLERTVKRYLSLGAGLQEVENQAFDDTSISKLLGYTAEEDEVEILNPLSSDQQYLRKHLLARVLGNVRDNLRFKDEFALFELGRIFKPTDSKEFAVRKGSDTMLPDQPRRLAAVIVSRERSAKDLFFEMKGIVSSLLAEVGIEASFVKQDTHEWLTNGAELGIREQMSGDEQVLGEFGVLHPSIATSLKLEAAVVALYIDYELLSTLPRAQAHYQPAPSQPPVTRDIAVVVPSSVPYADLEKAIGAQSNLLESYELFDLYEGAQVGAGNRSLAWHLSFRHPERTLKAEEADAELQKIVDSLETKFGATLRS